MSDVAAVAATPRVVDTALLKKQLRRHERGKQAIAVALVAPLFLYLLVNFVVPVGAVLFKSVDDDTRYVLVEAWATKEDLDAHGTSPGMAEMQKIGGLLAGRPTMHRYED